MNDYYDIKYKCEYSGPDCKIERGSLEDGLDNIAEYMGLNPSNTLFLHTTVVNDDSVSRRLFYKPSFSHSEILSYSSRSKGNKATGTCLYVNQGLMDYFNDSGISPSGNILKIDAVPDFRTYPNLSLSAHFKEHLLANPYLADRFRGYNIVTSFLSKDDVDIAGIIDGNLVMDPQKQKVFNSKYHFRKMGEDFGFSIPPGVSFMGLDSLEESIELLKGRLKELRTEETAEIWLKFESQTSGEGSVKVKGFNENSINILRKHIVEFSASIDVGENEMNSYLPLILELDVSSLPGEREAANIGVQAVIGERGITLVGSTSQISRDGRYIGSRVDTSMENMEKHAEIASLPAFASIHNLGYRGYMTIDVLLTRNEDTGEIKGYNIDPNARFTAGTPLLSLLHHGRKLSGKKLCGFSYSNAVRAGEDVFERIKDYAGKFLYMGASSNYEGIVPVVLNDKKNISENKYYLRTVVMSETMEGAENIYSEFKKKLIADL